jgi:PKD repeat protein
LPSATLVAAYSFDEGSGLTLHDSSGNGNNGTISNAAWSTAGKYGDALSFNGSSSWVTIPASPSLNLTRGMTLEAWIKPTALSGWRDILEKERPSGLSYALYASDGGLSDLPADGEVQTCGKANTVQAGPSPRLNAWTFLSVTYDGAAIRMYVNGNLVSSRPGTGAIVETNGVLRIGGDSVWGEYFKGLIDNVRIYNGALSQAAIQADMTTPVGSSSSSSSSSGQPGSTPPPGPTANAGPAESGTDGSPITFAGTSSGGVGPFTYVWTFGDGTQGTGALTPSHTYASPGSYTATFIVTDSLGQTSQSTTIATVSDAGPPTVSAGGPYSGLTGTAVTFTATASDPNPAEQSAGFTYVWTFGDGGTAVTAVPTVSYSYSAAGSYPATVTITDSDGDTASDSTSVVISSNPLQAQITGMPSSGHSGEGQQVSLGSTVSGGAAGPIQESWVVTQNGLTVFFGSGVSFAFSPNDGTYQITLTATDSSGATAGDFTTLVVDHADPSASLNGPYSGQTGTAVGFTATASDPNPAEQAAGFTYAWSFGDGTTENTSTATTSHAYAAAGTYTLTVTITDSDGDTASASASVTVSAASIDPLNKPVFNQSSFTYLGSFKLPTTAGGLDTAWSGGGLAFRYVNGNLQFFTTTNNNTGSMVYEVNYPGLGTDPNHLPQAQVVHYWGDIYSGQKWVANNGGTSDPAATETYGLYYDQAANRLYWSYGYGYNADSPFNPSLGYSVLNDQTGTATGVGAWSLANRPEKFDRGGVTPIPQWFADRFTGGMTLGVGFGGYFSVISSGSLGPALAAIAPPDPTANPDRSALANVPLVGYPYGSGVRADRDPNYNSRDAPYGPNPQNGVGTWTWSDDIWGGGVWIDTPTGGGVLIIAKVGQGNVWYQTSTTHSQSGSYEWMVYDPKDLAAVASGAKQQWQIQPKYEWISQTLPLGEGSSGWQGDGVNQIGGMSFDPTTNRLYVLSVGAWVNGVVAYPEIYVYQVGPPPSGGGSSSGWQETGLSAGLYTVQATWVSPAGGSAAVYQIYDGTSLVKTVTVDQTQAPAGTSGYQNLATVQVNSGTLQVVQVGADLTGNSVQLAPGVAASISGPSSGSAGSALTFTAAPSPQPGYSYSWSYGDGSTDFGQTVSHTFAAAGTYDVAVTVTAPGGEVGLFDFPVVIV